MDKVEIWENYMGGPSVGRHEADEGILQWSLVVRVLVDVVSETAAQYRISAFERNDGTVNILQFLAWRRSLVLHPDGVLGLTKFFVE